MKTTVHSRPMAFYSAFSQQSNLLPILFLYFFLRISSQNLRREGKKKKLKRMEGDAYRSETETGNKATVEEAVRHERDGRDGIYDRKNVVELERALSRPVVRLVHVPERGMPQRFVRPSCPKLHPHLSQNKQNSHLYVGL